MNGLKLFVTAGHPYAGKTTIAEKIAKIRGFHMLSFDHIWGSIKPNESLNIDRQYEWDEIYVIAMTEIKEFLTKSQSVIFDDISSRKWKELEHLAASCNAEYKIIYLDIPIEEIVSRRNKNLVSRDRHHVADDNFYRGIANFVPPQGDHVVEYKWGEDIDAFISKL